jgi:CheY-like chemotaxis protein
MIIEINRIKMEQAKEQGAESRKKRLLLVDDDITTKVLAEQFNELYEIETTELGQEAIRKLQYGKFDALVMELNLKDMDGMDVLKAIKTEQLPVSPVIFSKEKDKNRIHVAGQVLLGAEYVEKRKNILDVKEALEEILTRQIRRKASRETKLPQDELSFTEGTEALVADTYPLYLLGGEFWDKVLKLSDMQGKLERLEFNIVPRMTYRGEARIIDIKAKAGGIERRLVTLKNTTQPIDDAKKEVAVYLGCPDARTITCHGYTENQNGFNIVLGTFLEPTLDYLLTAITANRMKHKQELNAQGIETDEILKMYNDRKKEVIEKSLETIAVNCAKRSINIENIEKEYLKLKVTDQQRGFTTQLVQKENAKKHKERLERYLKGIMLWKARDVVYDENSKSFNIPMLDNFCNKEYKIGQEAIGPIKELYSDMLLDKDHDGAFYFMNQSDMRLHNMVMVCDKNGKEEVKDFDLKRCKQSVLGWDAMEFLTEHLLDLSYDEVDNYYDYFLLKFINESVQYGTKPDEVKGFKGTFGIKPEKQKISSLKEINDTVYKDLKQSSFLLRQIMRLRKMYTITETRFKKVQPKPYLPIDIPDKVLGEFKQVNPSNYLGEDWLGIDKFYECQCEKLKEEIERMTGEKITGEKIPEHKQLWYELDEQKMFALKTLRNTFRDFKYKVNNEEFILGLWDNKVYVKNTVEKPDISYKIR